MKTFFNSFGFADYADFIHSFVCVKMLAITIPFAAIIACIENYFGLSWATFICFVAVQVTELVSGIMAAKKEGQTIESRKFGRFGLKAMMYYTFLLVLFTFAKEQSENGEVAISAILAYTHSLAMIYIIFEYLISIEENYSRYVGKKTTLVKSLLENIKKIISKKEDAK